MKFAIKILVAAAAACAFAAPASAYTLAGVIPPSSPPKPVTLNLHQPIPKGLILFIFYAPPVNAGVAYAIDFCIGPAFNPCGLPTSTVVTVPKGQSRHLIVDSSVFAHIFVAGQGTFKPVPYVVNVTPIPFASSAAAVCIAPEPARQCTKFDGG
jgi:hypothetical protein